MSDEKKMRQTALILLSFLFGVSSYHSSFFTQDEMNHNRVEREDLPPCNEDSLMNFLAEIQVINPESIVKLATLNELQPSCQKVTENLNKVDVYLKTCAPPNQPDLYMQLIKGVKSLEAKLCGETTFKKRFVPIHKCLHELRNDLEDCSGPADWNENSDDSAVCKAYKDVADCYYIKTAKVCGKNAATTTKELLQAIIDSILTINCGNVRSNPSVKDAMPEAYMKKENKGNDVNISYMVQIITLIILIIN